MSKKEMKESTVCVDGIDFVIPYIKKVSKVVTFEENDDEYAPYYIRFYALLEIDGNRIERNVTSNLSEVAHQIHEENKKTAIAELGEIREDIMDKIGAWYSNE